MPTKSKSHADVEAFVAELEAQGHTVVGVSTHETGAYVTWAEKKNRKTGEVEKR